LFCISLFFVFGDTIFKGGDAKVGFKKKNCLDNTTWEFPRTGFWLVHIVGSFCIFMLGARFAARRIPIVPIMALRLLRMIRER
jgi:hypothetical protein